MIFAAEKLLQLTSLDRRKEYVKLGISNPVSSDIEILKTLMISDAVCKASQICVAEAIVLHRQFFHVWVVIEDADQFADSFTRELVPRDVDEDKLTVINLPKDLSENRFAHLTVIQTENLQHAKFIDHVNYTCCQLSRNQIIAEIKSLELSQASD